MGHRSASARHLSLAATKKVMRFAADHDWAVAYDLEAKLQGQLLGSEDNQGGRPGVLRKACAQVQRQIVMDRNIFDEEHDMFRDSVAELS